MSSQFIVTLTLGVSGENNRLELSSDKYTIGTQFDNNQCLLKVNRTDPYFKYIPYIVFQPVDSSPFTPIRLSSDTFSLSSLFTQSTGLDVQIYLECNYDRYFSNVLRLNLNPAIRNNLPIDISQFYQSSSPMVVKRNYFTTEEVLNPGTEISVPEYTVGMNTLYVVYNGEFLFNMDDRYFTEIGYVGKKSTVIMLNFIIEPSDTVQIISFG